MNPDSASSASSNPPASNQRKERGAIAAQACDTCRARKQKCDEQRPKCGLCQRMKLECNYREPQPTKKDKTLVEILDRLKSLEGKVDRIPKGPMPPIGFGPAQTSPASRPSFTPDNEQISSYNTSSVRVSQHPSPSATNIGKSQPYRHASAAHKMLTWPAIQVLLNDSLPDHLQEFRSIDTEGSAFIVRLQRGTPQLPMDDFLQERPFVGMMAQATRNAGGARVTFPDLTKDVMLRLANAYFDTFNFIYPFMDRQNFLSDTLARVQSEGFNGDTDSVLALLVFALGELSLEAYHGKPTDFYRGRASGLRGGDIERPPGIALFNEARKRIGCVLTQCDLENVQIFSLAALYYESCSRHVDFWRLTVSASSACQVLITCYPIDWNSPRGDLIKRVYWHCAIMETGLHLELDLPFTGVTSLEDRVGLPTFNAPFCESDHKGNQQSHFEKHFASQIALRRLCADIHSEINDSMSSLNTPTSSDEFTGPTPYSIKKLDDQLEQWRSLLPLELQWSDEDPTAFPSLPSPPQTIRAYSRPLDPSLGSHRQSQGSLFTTDLNREPVYYPYAYDIQVALLRTRYYYAKYMVFRPFVYKALHYPKELTQLDAEGVAKCLKTCIRWPLTYSPASRRKRLIPYLFCWSQNFLGILLILHLSRIDPCLRSIREQFCGPRFDSDAQQSIELMLDWIRDLKSSDAIASWCYDILKVVYPADT